MNVNHFMVVEAYISVFVKFRTRIVKVSLMLREWYSDK